MRIIDDKGRLWGKINIIDFIVILLLTCLIPLFYFGYKILNKPLETKEPVNIYALPDVELYVLFKNLTPETAKLISIGDKEETQNGKLLGEILSIVKNEPNVTEVNLGIDPKTKIPNVIRKEAPDKRQVLVKLRLNGDFIGDTFYYKDEKIYLNSPIEFKTDRYVANGIVQPEPLVVRPHIFSMYPLSGAELYALFKNLTLETAKSISVGDIERDGLGNIIAQILSVGEIKPYVYEIDLGGGTFITKESPDKKQVIVKMEARGTIEEKDFYFKDKRVTVGSRIEFNTEKYKVDGTITTFKLPLGAELYALFKNLTLETAKSISVGDIERDGLGNIIAQILSVGEIKPYVYEIDLGGGTFITKESPDKKQVIVKMEARGTIEEKDFYFKDKRVTVGSRIEFNTEKYKVDGIITTFKPAIKYEEKWLLLKVRFNGLIPELASIIEVGDRERDSYGNLIAEVKSIITDKPAESVVYSEGSRQLIIAEHPMNRDVVLSINALCRLKDKGVLFKDEVVLVGKNVSLQTDKYDINGVIIDIKILE